MTGSRRSSVSIHAILTQTLRSRPADVGPRGCREDSADLAALAVSIAAAAHAEIRLVHVIPAFRSRTPTKAHRELGGSGARARGERRNGARSFPNARGSEGRPERQIVNMTKPRRKRSPCGRTPRREWSSSAQARQRERVLRVQRTHVPCSYRAPRSSLSLVRPPRAADASSGDRHRQRLVRSEQAASWR